MTKLAKVTAYIPEEMYLYLKKSHMTSISSYIRTAVRCHKRKNDKDIKRYRLTRVSYKKNIHCLDCGKLITNKSKRCSPCNMKEIWRKRNGKACNNNK